MNQFLQGLEQGANKTYTGNGAVGYKATLDNVLDLFTQVGNMTKYFEEGTVKSLVEQSYGQNPLMTLKVLFLMRDIREGNGVRDAVKVAMKHLVNDDAEAVKAMLPLFAEYGRWDDVLVFLDTELADATVALLKTQLEQDLQALSEGQSVSLLGKWLPSINTSNAEVRKHARTLAKGFGLSYKEYRKTLSTLRNHIDVVERKMSAKNFGEISYEKVPSKAIARYRNAFQNQDTERFESYLTALANGDVKVNASTLSPYELVKTVVRTNGGYFATNRFSITNDENTLKLANAQWKQLLEEFVGESVGANLLPVCDFSESMHQNDYLPLFVAIGLSMFLAEKNEGNFGNSFLSFADEPTIHTLRGENFAEKLANVFKDGRVGYSTNVEATFQLILNTAINGNFSQEDMPSTLVYFSDMNFNPTWADKSRNIYSVQQTDTVFEQMKEKFRQAGYEMPHIVFWNILGSTQPATKLTENVTLISGFSQNLMKNVVSGKGLNPYEAMLQMLSVPRYEAVEVAYNSLHR